MINLSKIDNFHAENVSILRNNIWSSGQNVAILPISILLICPRNSSFNFFIHKTSSDQFEEIFFKYFCILIFLDNHQL